MELKRAVLGLVLLATGCDPADFAYPQKAHAPDSGSREVPGRKRRRAREELSCRRNRWSGRGAAGPTTKLGRWAFEPIANAAFRFQSVSAPGQYTHVRNLLGDPEVDQVQPTGRARTGRSSGCAARKQSAHRSRERQQ